MTIAVINRSSVCTDADVARWTQACGIQVAHDCAPAWNIAAQPVEFVPHGAVIPAVDWPIYILDDSDQQGALGWHAYDGNGNPYGRVFARTCQQYGAVISTVLSHEVLEALVDPFANAWRNGYALEVGDPVESDSYPISLMGHSAALEEDDELGRRHRKPVASDNVLVSNFAMPAWWTPGSAGPWDFLGRTTGPFVLTPGGYAMTQNGTVWGDEVPAWKKLVKITDGSRTLRLIAGRAPEYEPLRAELLALDRAA